MDSDVLSSPLYKVRAVLYTRIRTGSHVCPRQISQHHLFYCPCSGFRQAGHYTSTEEETNLDLDILVHDMLEIVFC